MKRTRLNPVSRKQREKNAEWKRITDEVCQETGYICMYCGYKGQRTVPERMDYLDGHHIVKRRFNIHTKENCYICDRRCHQYIHNHNIDVRSLTEAMENMV